MGQFLSLHILQAQGKPHLRIFLLFNCSDDSPLGKEFILHPIN